MPLSAQAFLHPELIDLDLPTPDGPGAIARLSLLFQQRGLVKDAPKFAELVLAREKLCSTVLGSGVAFPHARTDLVSEIAVAVGRRREGVIFTPEQPPTQLIFLIGTPTSMVREYLDLVGQLARRLRAESVRQRLLQVESAEDFLTVLTDQPLAS